MSKKISAAILLILTATYLLRAENRHVIIDYTKFADPMVGTNAHGHTFPGATLPFGMIQLSPDTRTNSWDGCSGYHYSDRFILGFSHTHFSGTGVIVVSHGPESVISIR